MKALSLAVDSLYKRKKKNSLRFRKARFEIVGKFHVWKSSFPVGFCVAFMQSHSSSSWSFIGCKRANWSAPSWWSLYHDTLPCPVVHLCSFQIFNSFHSQKRNIPVPAKLTSTVPVLSSEQPCDEGVDSKWLISISFAFLCCLLPDRLAPLLSSSPHRVTKVNLSKYKEITVLANSSMHGVGRWLACSALRFIQGVPRLSP